MILLKIGFTLIMIAILSFTWFKIGEMLYDIILDFKKWRIWETVDVFYAIICFLLALGFTLYIIFITAVVYVGGL